MTTDPVRQKRWLLIASYASVSVAGLLIVAKLFAWAYTGSTSILASLIDSLMDSGASLVNLFAVRYALRPPDATHRFGHGKAESIAAVAQAAFIVGSGVLLFLHCAERLWSPTAHHVEHSATGMVVIVAAIALTAALLLVQGHAIRLTDSETLRADRLHYRSDLLMNVAVLLALFAVAQGLDWVDLILGMLIALYMAFSALQIGYRAVQGLMDQELPDSVDEEIRQAALSQPGVLGVHDLRTRRSGRDYIIQLHVEMEDDTPLLLAHDIADSVEDCILQRFPNADVIIHQDPASVVSSEKRSTEDRVTA